MPFIDEHCNDSSRNGLRLGVEIETLLSSKYAPEHTIGMDVEAFANVVCEEYNLLNLDTGRPDMCTDIGKGWKHIKHPGWLLTSDRTIRGQSDTSFPIEMVSPIFHFQPSSKWRTEIKDFFASMSSLYNLNTNRSCGFHVHLSPGDPSGDRVDWTLDELKNIAMAVVYFEDAFELLIPETRRGSKWHRPNRAQNHAFRGLDTAKCLRKIGEVQDVAFLCLMMHQSENSNWNFMNIYAPCGTGTVEFRQPPGVTDAAGCLSWAELAVDFVQSARGPGLYAGIGRYPQTVEGLEQFCYDGMTLGVSNPNYLDPLFAGKSGALEARWADELEDDDALVRKECYDITHRAHL